MFWIFLIAIAFAWVVQSVLSYRQTKAFTQLFVALRRKGRVAMGKFRGGLVAGSIVMFVLDEDDRIVEGQRLGGVTVLARFKEFNDFNGQHIGSLDPQQVATMGKPLVRAVANARENYRLISRGEVAPEPPTAVARMLDKLPGINRKPRVLPEPVGTPTAAVAPKTGIAPKTSSAPKASTAEPAQQLADEATASKWRLKSAS